MAVSARGGSDSGAGRGLWPGTPAGGNPQPAAPNPAPANPAPADQAWPGAPVSGYPPVLPPDPSGSGGVVLEPAPPTPQHGRGRHRRGQRRDASVEATGYESLPPADWEPAPRGGGCWRVFREFVIVIVVALVLSALVRAFLVQAFFVPSESMEPTLVPNDRILVSKVTTDFLGVKRGEVVVFQDPGGWLDEPAARETGWGARAKEFATFMGLLPSDTGRDLVKRAIAVGGDTIACCDANGRIVLNGVSLDEPYIQGPTNQVLFNVTVPDGTVFVMGDNRGNSRDSRYHLEQDFGGVPLADVVGRSVLVLWPFRNFSTIPVPPLFDNAALQRPPSR